MSRSDNRRRGLQPQHLTGLPAAPDCRGFTLTEVLVVIGIIAFLVALSVPAVVRARSAARTAVIKKELDQLHQAMTVYGTKYGEFPPSWSPNILINGTIPAVSGTNAPAAVQHLIRLFPRSANAASWPVWMNKQATALTFWNQSSVFRACSAVTPGVALTAWLHGYIPSNINRLAPVAPDQMNPFSLVSGTVTLGAWMTRSKLYDFDYSRVSTGTADYGAYRPPRCVNSPYVYIDAANYGPPGSPAPYAVVTPSGTTVYTAEMRDSSTFFNSDTFQILCAGVDGVWPSDDDLSNFWKGTRKQFQESGK